MLAFDWDTSYEEIPKSIAPRSVIDDSIRRAKRGVRERMEREHHWGVYSEQNDGRHKAGFVPVAEQGIANDKDTFTGMVEGSLYLVWENDKAVLYLYDGTSWIAVTSLEHDDLTDRNSENMHPQYLRINSDPTDNTFDMAGFDVTYNATGIKACLRWEHYSEDQPHNYIGDTAALQDGLDIDFNHMFGYPSGSDVDRTYTEDDVVTVDDYNGLIDMPFSKEDKLLLRELTGSSSGEGEVYNTICCSPTGGISFFTTRTYVVGDTGPAGGTIFYIDTSTLPDTYFELAPLSTQWERKLWAGDEVEIGGDAQLEGVGDGQAATDAIIAHIGSGSTYAAQFCDGFSFGGYSDWFLPTKGEMREMYNSGQFDNQKDGSFYLRSFWTSTEIGGYNAWTFEYDDNEFVGGYKVSLEQEVRAVRMFGLSIDIHFRALKVNA